MSIDIDMCKLNIPTYNIQSVWRAVWSPTNFQLYGVFVFFLLAWTNCW